MDDGRQPYHPTTARTRSGLRGRRRVAIGAHAAEYAEYLGARRFAQFDSAPVSNRIGCSVLCPAWVASEVFEDFERLRPEGVPTPAASPAGAQLMALQQQFLAAGIPAREVGELVLDAVRERRFYVLTHPAWAAMVEARARAIAEGADPARPAPPIG